MNDIFLFMSTDIWDPVSAVIRWETDCDWSHTGWYRKADGYTYSAMSDGKGLAWRAPTGSKKLILSAPKTEESLVQALKWAGAGYDFLDILGIGFRKNWESTGKYICDKAVFCAYQAIGSPLLQHKFIPLEHLSPRDILVSPFVDEVKL